MGKKIALLVVVLLVALLIGGYAYMVWRDAETMRAKIYRPLLNEVSQVQEVVMASNMSRAVPNTVFTALQKDPLWQNVPEPLRDNAKVTYEKVFDCQSEMVVAHAHWIAMSNLAAKVIRKQADDQAWLDKVNQASPAPAAAGRRKFLYREAQIDRSDPAHPRRNPGGPYWHMTDWLDFPQNIAALEKEWGENEFLYLTDSMFDSWDFRITHDDLRRSNLTLEQFMSNLLQSIANYGRIKGYREYCTSVLPMLDALKKDLAERAK